MITIDDDVFWGPPDDDWWPSNETIWITGYTDEAATIAALERAASRMLMIDERGHTYSSRDEIEADDGRWHTPSFSAAGRLPDGRLDLYVDCKSVITPQMREAFCNVLREELQGPGLETIAVHNLD